MTHLYRLYATAPRGVSDLLAAELRDLGGQVQKEESGGVSWEGTLAHAYDACLWSRLANRILLPIAHFECADTDALYHGVGTLDWSQHLPATGTLAVDVSLRRSAISHSQFAAQRVKDAIVDQLRGADGSRPSVDLQRPDVRVNVYVERNHATVSIDLSGESLHRRGYRLEGMHAPLKENLAAAMLLRARWPEVAAEGGALIDPMCGSGTLPLEAALMAADIAPGLLRTGFGFLTWRGHDESVWQAQRERALERKARGAASLPPILGFDADPAAIRAARSNAERAQLSDWVQFEPRRLDQIEAPDVKPGLVLANPPYGERLGEKDALQPLYTQLAQTLKEHFLGWRAAVFTGNPELAKNMGLRARRYNVLFNGAIECRLLHFDIEPRWFVTQGLHSIRAAAPEELGAGAQMLANRLRKNRKELGRWAQREGIECYRVYDADLPEYAVAVDLYQADARWVHVQEYQAPAQVEPAKARARLREVLAVVSQVFEVPQARIALKVRKRQKGTAQYEKHAEQGQFLTVRENGLRFLVNLFDYLDTGLFLDHRPTRQLLREQARDRDVLNLFAYTGTASVYAAAGGARSTTTVDMSATYVDWARRNLELNGFLGAQHHLVQADCLAWLERQVRAGGKRYGLIFLDPPTFSSSKRMQQSFDVQRDHVSLLRTVMKLLAADGELIFSNNFRKFRLDRDALSGFVIEDLSAVTLPRDFARNPRIHNCWRLRHA